MKIRDRVKELRRVRAAELIPNPRNWRRHPPRQQEALRGILAEIGYADALLARQTPDGGLMLIDGHLRAETTPDAVVPVLVLDVDEAEANKLLVTLDPLAGLAEADSTKLEALLCDVQTDSRAVQEMLADLATRTCAVPPAEPAPLSPGPPVAKYAIIVNCESEAQQLELLNQFEQEGLECRALVV